MPFFMELLRHFRCLHHLSMIFSFLGADIYTELFNWVEINRTLVIIEQIKCNNGYVIYSWKQHVTTFETNRKYLDKLLRLIVNPKFSIEVFLSDYQGSQQVFSKDNKIFQTSSLYQFKGTASHWPDLKILNTYQAHSHLGQSKGRKIVGIL